MSYSCIAMSDRLRFEDKGRKGMIQKTGIIF